VCDRSLNDGNLAVYVRIIIDRPIEVGGGLLSSPANHARKDHEQASGKGRAEVRALQFASEGQGGKGGHEEARRLQEGFSLLLLFVG